MEEHSIEDRFASIEAKLELLLHKLDQRIHNDSLMEQGVLPYQGSSNPTFQEEEELSPVKEQIFIYMEGNKKMINLHEQKFPDLDAFQVNTSARLKNVEAQIGHLVQAFKEKFSRTSPSNTLPNPNECIDTPLSSVQKFPILKSMEEGENELEIENKALLNNLDDEESLLDKLKFEEVSQVMAIENILVKIDTFTFPMDFVTWGIEGDLQNSHILRRPLLSSSQAWIDINKGELVTPPTRHRVSSEGSLFFFFFITFTLAYSYNVKHLTCIILCSSGLQNIYIQAPYMEVFNIYNIYIVYKISYTK